jgi:hypothetical protein
MPCVFLKRGHRRAIPSFTLSIRPGFSQHGAGSRPLHRASRHGSPLCRAQVSVSCPRRSDAGGRSDAAMRQATMFAELAS